MDSEGFNTREVYAYYGVAMFMCQCIERGLASMMCAVFPPKDRISSREMYDDLLSSHFEKTLGQLINKLRKHVNVPEEMIVTLSKVLNIRNNLAHNYFFEKARIFMRDEGKLEMAKELQETIVFLESVDKQMNVLVEDWLKERGASVDYLKEETEKLLSSEDYFNEVLNIGKVG